MKIIDYSNGASGNTILAHILFACNKVDIPLANLSSTDYGQGNVHDIPKYNNTVLTAAHIEQNVFTGNDNEELIPVIDKNVVLEIKTKTWSEVLRLKFSYDKFFQEYPDHTNYKKFFNLELLHSQDDWIECYNNYKDTTWPECNKGDDYTEIVPIWIQIEMRTVYQSPINIVTKENFVELLQKLYIDSLNKKQQEYDTSKYGGRVYGLDQYYFEHNFDMLKQVADELCWTWDHDRSNTFYSWVQKNNQSNLNWLDQMKEQCYNKVITTKLDWEIALLNAITGEYSGKTI